MKCRQRAKYQPTTCEAAYDNVLNAKRAAKLRRQSLNSRLKKLREDLEAREKKAEEAAKYNKHTNIGPRTCEEILKAEIERLRKEGSREVEAEVELVNQQVLKEHLNPQFKTSPHQGPSCRLKMQWKLNKDDPENSGYSRKELLDILLKAAKPSSQISAHKKVALAPTLTQELTKALALALAVAV
uniref:Uncharacterized protein n=1 Tax=Timema monikensis TaxID=170555 RepID=A0A7R9EIN1_9NEOP|nr:unnamed protein product [Timema monikensis]